MALDGFSKLLENYPRHKMYEFSGSCLNITYLLKNFPQLVVIHTVKGFGVVNKAEVDVFLELSCFSDDPVDVGNLISGSSAFSKTNLNIWSSRFTYC